MRDLMVICPTLWRRAKVEKLLESWDAIPRACETDLALITDRADQSYDGLTLPKGVRIWAPVNQDLATTAEKTNAAARGFALAYRALMSTGDDAWFATPEWDRLLLEPLAGGPGFTYPDMDGREVTVPGICVISSPIVSALGWMFLPGLHHYWADNVWQELGRAAGCTYQFVPEVVFHDAYGPQDGTYARAQESGAEDYRTFSRWRYGGPGTDQGSNGPAYLEDADTIRRVAAQWRPGQPAAPVREQQGDWSC